ncbi:RNA 3'-terminal phosphate cyclase [Saliphagus sp. LR7]|uniref:RNA 3'-terminal phosphate cyclase n=1 Tax=Saliphagus sp. LR7 TaxID=2282654 RepID=UPI001E5CA11B|nr:RNA 3'-terminal phosphate cyclase [Saliphagus sp. LR7]
MTVRELDGSGGGGQFLRTALAVAALEGEPVRIEQVRGGRDDPGLKAQHLAVLETLSAITGADREGAELGAGTVAFDPGPVSGGEYAVEIGTAGSLTLLFDALLPLAVALEEPLSVTATGGTDVAWSPPMDYQRHVKLPLLRAFGLAATVEVDRRGFYPAGGGRVTLHLFPSALEPIALDGSATDGANPGGIDSVRIHSTEAAALADSDVAKRQAGAATERLDRAIDERVETTAESPGPGSAIVVVLADGGLPRAGFTALGEPGKLAERVGEAAADGANRFLERDAEDGPPAVDPRLADQLLPTLALAGGRYRTPAVTDHLESAAGLLADLGYDVSVSIDAGGAVVSGADDKPGDRPRGDDL